jgi:D-amino peptidase
MRRVTDVFISIDMEGLAGIAHGQQVSRGSDDYPAARRLMAEEANAAIDGAFAAGAGRVVVNDSHGDMRNLVVTDIDERAELLIGSPKVPYGMMQGIDGGFGVAFFLGYHARAGTEDAILDHTYSSVAIYDLRVNGESWGEGDLNAALAGVYGIPVGLFAGDDKACEQAEKRIPGVRTVVVKRALGRANALTIHPNRARAAIRQAAEAVTADAMRNALSPLKIEPPYVLEADLANTGMAELAAIVPGASRVGPRTVRFETEDLRDVVRCRMAWTTLAGTLAR